MAKQTINIGTTANDGTGDTIRSAFDKTNDNFDEVYSATATIATKEPIKREITEDEITFESDATGTTTFTGDEIVLNATGARSGVVVVFDHAAEIKPSVNYGDFTLLGTIKGKEYVETTPATRNVYTFVCREIENVLYVEQWIDNDEAELIGDLLAANNLSDLANAATARTNLDVYSTGEVDGLIPAIPSIPAFTQTGGMSMFIETVADQDYIFAIKMPFAGTITETTTKATSGTATATFKINSTALGGTANAISSAEQSQAHASANTFAAGDDIICTVSANSTCLKASLNIKFTYTLA